MFRILAMCLTGGCLLAVIAPQASCAGTAPKSSQKPPFSVTLVKMAKATLEDPPSEYAGKPLLGVVVDVEAQNVDRVVKLTASNISANPRKGKPIPLWAASVLSPDDLGVDRLLEGTEILNGIRVWVGLLTFKCSGSPPYSLAVVRKGGMEVTIKRGQRARVALLFRTQLTTVGSLSFMGSKVVLSSGQARQAAIRTGSGGRQTGGNGARAESWTGSTRWELPSPCRIIPRQG